jgi:hypothetical protein
MRVLDVSPVLREGFLDATRVLDVSPVLVACR